MAVTPVLPTQFVHPATPPGSVTPVEEVGKPRQEALDNALRRENLISAEMETLVTLDSAGVAGNRANQTGPVAKVSSTPLALLAANLPEDAANATKAFLSEAGRLIDQLLHVALEEKLPTSVQGKQPVLASPPAQGDAQQAALALKNTLDQSGLFYESHISEWANNERSLASLLQEPQALLSSALPSAVTENGTPLTKHPATAADMLNASMAQMVSQQLTVLEQNRIVWQGEIWPGQPMTWEVSDDTPKGQQDDGREGGDAPPTVWRSDLRFDLPNLGSVAAKVYWSGGRVQVQVRAADDLAASSLQAHGTQLADALGSAGCALEALQVGVDASGHPPA